jgi:hypothetical protein
VDVPQVVNFLAARALTGDTDCCHKNYYFYRDTNRSNEWQMWPWDVDLSFGRVWTSSMTYWDQTLNFNTSLFVGNNNRVPQVIFNTPEIRQMYLRRIRTLMDELLKSAPTYVPPPPTPVPGPTPRPRGGAAAAPIAAAAEPNAPLDMHYERIDELAAQIGPDAALDAVKWNSHAWGNGSTAPNYPQPFADAVKELRDSYLPQRRRQLFNGLSGGAAEIPGSQPAGTTVSIAAVEIHPARSTADEGYIQLLNPNAFAVDISSWTLVADGNAKAPLYTFHGGTVIPANGTLYVAANRVAFRACRIAPPVARPIRRGDYGYRLRLGADPQR